MTVNVAELTKRQPQEKTGSPQGSFRPDWELPKVKGLRSYNTVLEEVEYLEKLAITPQFTSPKSRGIPAGSSLGPQCVSLNKLLFTDAGTVKVPGFGLLRTTSWAERQLGNLIGVRFSKFFKDQDPEKINRAIRDHLRAQGGAPVVQIVARQHLNREAGSDGILRGLVGTKYSPVPDAKLLERIQVNVGAAKLDQGMGFSKADMRDNGSHFCLVYKDPIDLSQRKLPATAFSHVTGPHGSPGRDIGFFGIRLRNSQVGAYSLTGDGYLMRLVCVNGVMQLIAGERLMKRKHRGIDEAVLDNLIKDTFRKLPGMRQSITADNTKLARIKVPDPQGELRNFLARQGQPQRVQEAAANAYTYEETPTALGVLQAITRLGMSLRDNPDRQHELEIIGGQYVYNTLKAA